MYKVDEGFIGVLKVFLLKGTILKINFAAISKSKVDFSESN